MELEGLHHLTAISARIRDNYRFYTRILGMRLVKRSVNQDDVSADHLFYADGRGSPGTDLTFFDWSFPREIRGTRSIVRTGLRVQGAETVEWWAQQLREAGVAIDSISERYGRATLDFEDEEGQRLAIVDDGGAGDEPVVWDDSPVPPERQIRGLGPVTLSVPELAPTDAILREIMSLDRVGTYVLPGGTARSPAEDPDGESEVYVYEMKGRGPHAELHVAVEPELPVARQGAGAVHHVAFRTPNEAEYDAWATRLNTRRIPNSGKVDRYYFKSLYFREPNGILFEIATDGPGFGVDEDPASLGERLALPPFLEPRRERIEANLRPLE